MNEICTDNRFKLIKKYKQELVNATNIETSPEEMVVIDNILFRFWQMGWLEKLERKVIMTPHGRLIDADKLLKNKTDHEMISTHLIYNASTVIESESEYERN